MIQVTKKLLAAGAMFALLGLASLAIAQDVTLEWWDYYVDGPNNAAIVDLIERYEAEHPNVTIERTTFPFADLMSRIIQGAATRNMPDIVIVNNPDHHAVAAQGALADITDRIEDWPYNDLYFDGPWSSTVFEGVNYGIPFGSNATALYYDADLLAGAGIEPPETWEELRAAASELTEGDRAGFCFSAVPNQEGTFSTVPFLWQAGGDITTIGDDASIETLEFLRALAIEDRSIPQGLLSMSQFDVYTQFSAGRCAMMINGPWQMPLLESDPPAFEWGVAPWPSRVTEASALGGENFAIGAGSNIDAAWSALEWITEPENLKPALEINGYLPNRTDMAQDDDLVGGPHVGVFAEMVAIARSMTTGTGTNFPEISDHFMRMVHSVLLGSATPEEAAEEAAADIQPLLP